MDTEPTARELLIDVSATDFDSFASDGRLDLHHPAVLRVMRRLTRIDYELLERLAEPSWEAAEGQLLTGRLFSLTGDVHELRVVDVPPAADRPESGLSVYLVQVVQPSGAKAWVASCEIPSAWRGSSPESNPSCSCAAYFLKWINEAGEKIPLLATRRLAWHPQTVADGVSVGLARLGQAGVDVGLLDWVRPRAGQKLDRGEVMCLVQMIAKAQRALADAHGLPTLDVVKLLQEPRGQEGASAKLVGTVERITPIDMSGNSYARWLGLKRYFQLDMFVSIGDRRINVPDKSKSNALTFEYDYPATLVVAELPPELQRGDPAGTLVEVPVVFFRLWSFPSIMTRRVDSDRRQVAPLFVGAGIRIITPDSASFSNSVTWMVVGGVALFALLALWLWSTGRRDRQRRVRPLPDFIDFKD